MVLPMSDKQVLSVRESVKRINVWQGSVRSGKTIASLLRFLIYIATTKVRGELIVVSRTRDSAARNVFAPLMDPTLFGEVVASQVEYTPGAPTAKVLGRTIWVLGSSDIRSENVLRGLTCAGAYVDEITLLHEDFFTQLLNRLWEGAQLFGTTNPDSPAHWFKVRHLDVIKERHDWAQWQFYLDDNPALTEERKAAIRRENVGLYYRRNVLGEWVAADGAVFPMWDVDRHVIPWDDLPHMSRLLAVGIDYGTNNPTAALLLGISRELDERGNLVRQRLYVIDEWGTAKGHGLDDVELSRRLRAWLDKPHLLHQNHLEPAHIIVDPSAASFKARLFLDGVHNMANADNDVEYGLKTLASLLGTGNLMVSDRCTGFINEVPGYAWDTKKADKGLDAPIKVADHYIDACRYAVVTTENLWRNSITI